MEEEANALQRQGDLVVNETVKVESQIRENLQIRKTIEKSSASTAAGVNKMTLSIDEKVLIRWFYALLRRMLVYASSSSAE